MLLDKLRQFWKNHRTKSLGFLVTAFGAAQTYLPNVQGWFKRPEHYGLAFAVVGVATAVLGFLNSHQDKDEQ